VSPQSARRLDALWTTLAQETPSIEAITFHEASSDIPPAWAIALGGHDLLVVDALSEPDRLVFSMSLGEVRPDQRLCMQETALRQTVLDIQGAAHAWRYFLQTRHLPEETVVLEPWPDRA